MTPDPASFGAMNAQPTGTHTGYRGTRTTRFEGDRMLYVREYPEHWRGREAQVEFELGWLDSLGAAGLPVMRSVPTVDGQPFSTALGLPVAAFSPLPGEPRYPLSREDAATLGGLLAAVHLAPAPPAPPGVFRYDRTTLLEEPLAFGLDYLDPEERRAWLELGAEWRAVLDALPTDEPAYGPVHADLHQWNVVWEGGAPHLLDFALCGVGYRLYDLAAFLWPLRDDTAADPEVAAMCAGFLDGYRRVRPLLDAEERALSVFVRLRDLWEMRDFADWEPNFDPAKDVPGYLARFRSSPGWPG